MYQPCTAMVALNTYSRDPMVLLVLVATVLAANGRVNAYSRDPMVLLAILWYCLYW
jgi:hypothetical protein